MSNDTKVCCACRARKPLGEFNRKTASRDGRQPRCRECLREYKAAWSAKNRDVIREKSRAAYRADPERAARGARQMREQGPDAYRAKYTEYMRRWRAANPDHKDRAKAYMQEWMSRPEVRLQRAADQRKRKARIMASSSVTADQIRARVEYFGGKCWMCGGIATTIDHVKPLAKGGLHLASNLRPACSQCNTRKHARWFGVDRLSEFIH